jgi:O-antigen/teichoic acid export membrane protein
VELVFGPPYAQAGTALRLLLLAVPIGALREVAVAGLIARHQEHALLRVNSVAVIVNVSLIVALVPPYGLAGAAGATVLSEIVRMIMALVATRAVIPARWPIARLARCLAAGGVMGAAIVALGLCGSLLAVGVGAVVYPVLLVAFGLVSISGGRRVHLADR